MVQTPVLITFAIFLYIIFTISEAGPYGVAVAQKTKIGFGMSNMRATSKVCKYYRRRSFHHQNIPDVLENQMKKKVALKWVIRPK